jgi:hypothetical protein
LFGFQALNFAVNVKDLAVISYFDFAADYCNGVNISACLGLSTNICFNTHLTALSRASTNRKNGE